MIAAFLDRWRNGVPRWMFVMQLFLGTFFVASVYYKYTIYFEEGRSIAGDFGYWESNGWPPMWYRWFIHFLLDLPQGHRVLELSVMALQGIGGITLVTNRYTRIGGWALLFVQTNVFLGTFHHRGFNEFVGLSLWMAALFAFRPKSGMYPAWAWKLFTVGMAGLTALYLYNRYWMGDPWLSGVEWQRHDLQADVMSSAWMIKRVVLAVAHTRVGEYLWASTWWINVACVALTATRFRMHGVAILTLYAILRTITWANSVTSQGVLFVLLYMLWMTEEDARVTAARSSSSRSLS